MSDERPASNEELRRLQERGVGGGPGPRHDQPRQDRGGPPRGGPAGGQGRGDDRGGGQGGPRGPGGGRPAPPGGRPEWGLPPDYLRGGYFDDGGYLRRELIVDQAKQIAGALSDQSLSMTALRRFYGMARWTGKRLEVERQFPAVRENILALKPYAAKAQSRSAIPQLFQDFLDRNVEHAVLGERDFLKGFLPHFEYVVAYFRERKDRR